VLSGLWVCNATLALALFTVGAVAQPSTISVPDANAKMDAVTDPLTVHFAVTNGTDSTVVVIPVVNVPQELLVGVRQKDVTLTNGSLQMEADSFDVPSKTTRTRDLVMLAPLAWRDTLTAPFFRWRSRDVQLTLRISSTETDAPFPNISRNLSVKPKGPWTGVVAGGLLGVLTIVAFALCYQVYQGQSLPPRPKVIVTILLGWITVIVASIALRFTAITISQLPDAINVNDFIGGFFLGIVFQPLVLWLARYIPLPGAAGTPPAQTPPAPPAQPPAVHAVQSPPSQEPPDTNVVGAAAD